MPAEAQMLYVLARDWYDGNGAIVDCGAFLGKSAALLAQGIMDNPRVANRAPLIHSYDWFRVCDNHDVDFIRQVTGSELGVGHSSRALFDGLTRKWSSLIQVHEGNFLDQTWTGGDIALLFIDVCKSPALNAHLLTTMFPALTPMTSIIVQQDYHHLHHPVIHLSLETLSDYIEPLATRVDDSFVFRLRAPIPPERLSAAAAVMTLAPQQQMRLMDSAVARLPAEERHFVELARVVLTAERFGRPEGELALQALAPRVTEVDHAKWTHELAAAVQRVARC